MGTMFKCLTKVTLGDNIKGRESYWINLSYVEHIELVTTDNPDAQGKRQIIGSRLFLGTGGSIIVEETPWEILRD